ncbi:MAG: hypothetical protein K0B11_03805 [Mariniphaga sp.]|nr:hypothetical protein [Mariniphaga sp.]
MNCLAITRDGSRIEINETNYSENEFSAPMTQVKVNQENSINREYFICLAVNLFERVPYGIPEPDETPPRLPYVLPGYHLSLHPPDEKKSILTGNSLIIGKLKFIDNKPEIDENYIPACQSIYSHPKLVEYHTQLIKILGQIEIDIVDILHNIKNKKQGTRIAETVAEISNAVLGFIGVHMVEFRKITKYKPPIFIFEQMAALARTINNAINIHLSADKEEFYNYIQDWSNLKQGEFERLLLNTVDFNYDHDDINNSINELAPFVNTISKVFNILSNLDFIGKKKDRQIFVKEQKEKPGNSFLVD